MCTVLLPPGDNPIAVNKYIISYISSTLITEAEVSSEFFENYLQSVTTSHPRRSYFNNHWCQNLEWLMAKTRLSFRTFSSLTDWFHASNWTQQELAKIKIHWDIQERNSWQDCLLQILRLTHSCVRTKHRAKAYVRLVSYIIENSVMRTTESQKSAERKVFCSNTCRFLFTCFVDVFLGSNSVATIEKHYHCL